MLQIFKDEKSEAGMEQTTPDPKTVCSYRSCRLQPQPVVSGVPAKFLASADMRTTRKHHPGAELKVLDLHTESGRAYKEK